MKEEISAAVLFISKLISGKASLPPEMMARFERRLTELLEERFSNHWHPQRPWQGQGYRCLRVNEVTRREPTLERAARDCGLSYQDLQLPVELTVWVDPEEVCCRFGEQKGSCCTVASFREGNKENFIDKFDFSKIERPSPGCTPSEMSKSTEVLKERRMDLGNNILSPPSSTQSTPTKKKSFNPMYSSFSTKTSPSRSSRERKTYTNNYHNHYTHQQHPSHLPNTTQGRGSYSPPFYKTQSWVNLSQTPPPPAHLPLLTSTTGFIYPPTASSHYTHAQMPPPFTRSPPSMVPPQKYKWNTGSYPRNDRNHWYGHRALARV